MSAALVGVGFAAWTISGGDAADKTTGLDATVTVGSMEEFTGLYSFSATMSEGALYLGGKPAGEEYSGKSWLTAGEDIKEDDLEITITLDMEGKLPSNGLTFELDTEDAAALTKVGLTTWTPTVSKVNGSSYSTEDFKFEGKVLKYAETEKELIKGETIEIKITFSGTYANPWKTHIKSGTYDATEAKNFKGALDKLTTDLSDLSGTVAFKITGVKA